jgi:hypothetical protein
MIPPENAMRKYCVTSHRMTIQVNVDADDIIHWTPPVARCFVGQRLMQLLSWMKAFGGLRCEELQSYRGIAAMLTPPFWSSAIQTGGI